MKREYLNIICFIILITKIHASGFNSRSRDVAERTCIDPNRFDGVCKSIKECSVVLKEFIAKSNDTAYVQYIKQSNANCDNIKPFICCPSDGRTYQFHDASVQGRLLTPPMGCGYSNQNFRPRIGSKHISKLGALNQFVAFLIYTDNNDQFSWKCVGSLITTRHVLTSARCVNSNLSMVRLGEYNLSASHNDVVQHIKIIRSERHAMNDIAILFLERDVGISPHIRPVCLPISEPIRSRSFVEYNPFIFGWDLLRKDRTFSNIPFEQQITVLDNKSCKERYQQLGKLVSANQFDQSVVCAGHLDKFDGCISEFGSPMLQPIRNGELDFRYYQTGIAAYGIECERTDGPAVFTSVQYHIDWIQEKINS